MGKRSRKRTSGQIADGEDASGSRAERDAARVRRAEEAKSEGAVRRRRRGAAERPPPPWGSFPLTELVTLLGIVLAIGGMISGVEENRGRRMLGAGIALGSLAGLETAIRDHFAGYRSHTTLLAAFLAIVALAAMTFALKGIVPELAGQVAFTVALGVGAVVFGIAFPLLRRVFQRRSGGLSYR
jgi:hypothetical protein